MSQPLNALAAGLSDPGHDAQRLFRAVLDAFAHPGRIASLADAPVGPGTISPATAAYLLTLIDRDTPLWLAPEFDVPAVRDFVRFHTGAPIVTARSEAAFAVLVSASQRSNIKVEEVARRLIEESEAGHGLGREPARRGSDHQ